MSTYASPFTPIMYHDCWETPQLPYLCHPLVAVQDESDEGSEIEAEAEDRH